MWKEEVICMKKKRLAIGILTFIVGVTGLGFTATRQADAASGAQRLVVDMSADTGEMMNGGTGFLYGMSEPNVPDINTLIPLKPHTAVQKAPDGLQHPNGDALKISDYFFEAGGKQIQIYIQDIYQNWPYEYAGMDDYLAKVETIVGKVLAHPNRDKIVYVPFNEPDYIWYSNIGGDKAVEARFFADWQTVVEKIRGLYETEGLGRPLIAGPNFASFNNNVFADFFTFAKENDVLPDIVTWHELSDSFFTSWDANYANYRAIEQSLGIGPLEIHINEYARPRDPSVPGMLVQYLSRFERSKVHAELPYWHAADNLNDLVVESNRANGAWWLYKWTADMVGSRTVQVTPPNGKAKGLDGIAAVDEEKKQASIVFGGASGGADLVLQGLKASGIFGKKIHVTVWESGWTGYDGAAETPTVVQEGDYTVVNGEVVIPVADMDEMSAYKAVITPATANTVYSKQPWKATYEAENAQLKGLSKIFDLAGSSSYIEWSSSNGKQVGSIDSKDSSVTFTVNIPEDGKYAMDIFYGNGPTGPGTEIAPKRVTAKHAFAIDGEDSGEIIYPANLDFKFIGIQKVYVDLKAGKHQLKFSGLPVSVSGQVTRVALLDRIDLTLAGSYKGNVSRVTDRYEAEYAELSGKSSVDVKTDGYEGTGYASLPAGKSSARFVINAGQDGYFQLKFRYATNGNSNSLLSVTLNRNQELMISGNDSTDGWRSAYATVFLKAGINLVDVESSKTSVKLDALDVTAAPDAADENITSIEAENEGNTLAGTAVAENSGYASSGQYVGWVGVGADNYIQFNDINVPKSGTYKLVVHYANNEQVGNHSYNANVVERHAMMSVNGAEAEKLYFRSTYSWESFRSIVLDVELQEGANTIRFYNDTEEPYYETYAPNFDRIDIAPLTAEGSVATLSGGSSVKVGEMVNLTYNVSGLSNGAKSVMLTVGYNPELLTFIGAAAAMDGIDVTAEETEAGSVNVSITGEEAADIPIGELFKLKLEANVTERFSAEVAVSDAVVTDSDGRLQALNGTNVQLRLYADVMDIKVSGEEGRTAIETNRGRLQMSAEVTPANAFTPVLWSVSAPDGTDTYIASIDANGLLSPSGQGMNGLVKVTAEAADGSGVIGEQYVNVTGQLVRLSGTPYGEGPPWSLGGEFDKAWDGSVNTYYDYSKANGGKTGVDLGEGNEAVISQIRYYPRSTFASRMVGGIFQGSNEGPNSGFVDLYKITATPVGDWNTVEIATDTPYRWVRYIAPDGGYGNVAEIELYTSSGLVNTVK